DLRAGRELESELVVAAEDYCRAVKTAGQCHGSRTVIFYGERRAQIPVDVVSVGDHRIGLEREPTAQHAIAYCRRQESELLMATRACEREQAYPVGARIRRGKGRQIPRRAKWLAARLPSRHQQEPVAPPRFQALGMELPVLAASIGHLADHVLRSDAQ